MPGKLPPQIRRLQCNHGNTCIAGCSPDVLRHTQRWCKWWQWSSNCGLLPVQRRCEPWRLLQAVLQHHRKRNGKNPFLSLVFHLLGIFPATSRMQLNPNCIFQKKSTSIYRLLATVLIWYACLPSVDRYLPFCISSGSSSYGQNTYSLSTTARRGTRAQSGAI
jgi:hypothetical protein